MDLVAGQQTIRRDAERRGHAGAVGGDVLRRVVRSDAGIERRIDAGRYAAGAGEEGMPDAGEPASAAPRTIPVMAQIPAIPRPAAPKRRSP